MHCMWRGWLVGLGQALLVKEKEGCVCACSSGRGGLYPYSTVLMHACRPELWRRGSRLTEPESISNVKKVVGVVK